MIHVNAKIPTRIDIAGGTLDLWPVHHMLDHKATVNVAVTVDANVVVTTSEDGRYHLASKDQDLTVSGDFAAVCSTTQLPLLGMLLGALWRAELPPLRIVTTAKSPAGAGLGGSSCLGIAVAGALLRALALTDGTPELNEHKLVQTVQDIEARLIAAPTGCQDYWGGLRGQVNIITFPYGGTVVTTLPANQINGLAAELLLCYSGKSRASAMNNWQIFKRVFDGDRALLATFNRIGSLAEACAAAVRAGNLADMLALSEQEWRLRTELWPAIETDETTRLDSAARRAGARFTRVCGAGGGGVMAVFVPQDRRGAVAKALSDAGGTILDATVSPTGLVVQNH